MLRIAGGPGRGWYPKQKQHRPVSNENLDRIHCTGRSWDAAAASRKPLTLPPNLSPHFFKKSSPTDALRRVTSLLIRNKGNAKDDKKERHDSQNATGHRAYESGKRGLSTMERAENGQPFPSKCVLIMRCLVFAPGSRYNRTQRTAEEEGLLQKLLEEDQAPFHRAIKIVTKLALLGCTARHWSKQADGRIVPPTKATSARVARFFHAAKSLEKAPTNPTSRAQQHPKTNLRIGFYS